MCTCPPKLTVNPYTGCDHQCVYCYASSYIQNFGECRPKKDLVQSLTREAGKLNGETISIANSSDPYPRVEATLGLTRRCLEVLTESKCRIQIITKSNLVTRDDDLLTKVPSTVALTITTDDDRLSSQLEPYAPPSSERIRAVQDLIRKGIPVSVRIDPVIPLVNDQPETLIAELASIGVKHITSSTYKAKPDNWLRFSQTLPKTAAKIRFLYFQQGEKMGGNTLLHKDLRLKILKNIRDMVISHGMTFGACREDLPQLNTAACDGSSLFKAK